MNYVRSKQRVADHGEVFTPALLVEAITGCTTPWWQGSEAQSYEPAANNRLQRTVRCAARVGRMSQGRLNWVAWWNNV